MSAAVVRAHVPGTSSNSCGGAPDSHHNVRGEFCHQMRDILTRADRTDDYLEFGLHTGFCYNPLHNDLDPYAVRHRHAVDHSVRAC